VKASEYLDQVATLIKNLNGKFQILNASVSHGRSALLWEAPASG
jgi:hypothetical protein